MKKILLTLIIFFTFCSQIAFCAKPKSKYVNKTIEIETKDAHIMKATMSYPRTKLPKYPTVVLLHSLGYSSAHWYNLKDKLLEAGYLVIAIDFRGHGQSIYNSGFHKKSWTYFTNKTFEKYPSDVITVLNQAQIQSKKPDFTNWAIIGADIGANTAVLVARTYPKKPKALVLISPSMTFKGLYIPVKMTEIGAIPILATASTSDNHSIAEQNKLSRFAQGKFYIKNYPNGGMGMLMLKSNPTMAGNITNWLKIFIK